MRVVAVGVTSSGVGALNAGDTAGGRRGGRRRQRCGDRRRKRSQGGAIPAGTKGKGLPQKLGRWGREGVDRDGRFGGRTMQGAAQVVGGESARG